MSQPQSGILPEANSHALFLRLALNHAVPNALQRVRRVCAAFPAISDQVAELDASAALGSVLGIGPGAWSLLFPGHAPEQLRLFRAREDGAHQAPSTPADLMLHVRSERADLNYELARRLRRELAECVSTLDEVAGFRYLDSRDLTGFVDGTENPEGDERAEVALVGGEDPDFAGGSYVLMQRYVHNLEHWEKLNVHEQEIVIGRTKPDDTELPKGLKPDSAHISRVVIEEDGEELEILRHSMPYGGADEAGLQFIAYCSTPDTFDRMLDRMFLSDEDGVYDHLMDYTRAVSGNFFFAPSRDFLAGLA
jgi:putative iron-dependent peroxidase